MKNHAAAIFAVTSFAAVFSYGSLTLSPAALSQMAGSSIQPSFESCSQVKIVRNEIQPGQRMEYVMLSTQNKMQRMPKMEFIQGITSPYSIKASLRLLYLTSERKIENIKAHLDYYQDLQTCLQNQTSNAGCQLMVSKFLDGIHSSIPELRRELALATGDAVGTSYSAIPKLHINFDLRSVQGMPNPAGESPLTESEYRTAEADFAKDRGIVKKVVDEKMAELKARSKAINGLLGFNERDYRIELLRAAYVAQKIEHQAAYKKILHEKPHLAYFPKGSLKTGVLPGIQLIKDSIRNLQIAGKNEIDFILATRSENRLEFERANGEAFWRGYVKGEAEMLSFITSPVTNDVLKENPKYCAIAEALLMRVSAKELQSFIISAALFGIGPTAGLAGVGVRGGLHLVKALGFARNISIASAVAGTSNISMGVIVSGGAVQLHRDQKHARMDRLSNSRP